MKRYLSNPSPRITRADAGILKMVTETSVVILRGSYSKTLGEHAKNVSNKQICPKFRNQRDAGYSEVWQLKNLTPQKRPPLTPHQKVLRLELAKKYMKTDMMRREQLSTGLMDGEKFGCQRP